MQATLKTFNEFKVTRLLEGCFKGFFDLATGVVPERNLIARIMDLPVRSATTHRLKRFVDDDSMVHRLHDIC